MAFATLPHAPDPLSHCARAWRILLLVLLAGPVAALAASTLPGVSGDAAEYVEGPQSADGIGRRYMGREIARVMGHAGAAWLERPGREREERTDRLLEALPLEPDDVVADIGAGTGYFSLRIAPRVPHGEVLAVDIEPRLLAAIEARARELGLANVRAVRGTGSATGLPAGRVDLALLVDAYHEFAWPAQMARSIVAALKPGGRVILVEYRAGDPSVRIKPLHTMSEAQARREWEAAGLRWVETRSILPQQHYLVFEKP